MPNFHHARMDYENVDADSFGRSLRGIGLNILVRDVRAQVAFLQAVFQMGAHQVSNDFAIVSYGDHIFQVHSDATYHSNPVLALLPELPPRGAGIELRLYDTDPDFATSRAEEYGASILQKPTDKPHGLREAYIVCENGYVWVPSMPKPKG